jgi:hypothetical protein
MVKVKVKFTRAHATEGPEWGAEVYLYSFFNLGAICECVVNAMLRPLYLR